jgi:hypothetical protein
MLKYQKLSKRGLESYSEMQLCWLTYLYSLPVCNERNMKREKVIYRENLFRRHTVASVDYYLDISSISEISHSLREICVVSVKKEIH